jgi:hypothetical protein
VTHETSPVDRRAFLAYGTRTGKVRVQRADGRAHVTPIWFVLDGDDVRPTGIVAANGIAD